MARPLSTQPTKSVIDVVDKDTGQIVAFRWSTFFPGLNGVPTRKEGKVSVEAVMRRLGPRAKREKAVREAETMAYAAMEAYIAGRPDGRETTMTVQRWAEYCLETILPLEGKKPRSIDEIDKALRRHVFTQLGGVPIAQLTPEMCTAWWVRLLEVEHTRTYRNKNGEVTKTLKMRICYKTAANVKDYFSTILNRAVRMNRLVFNPVDAIPVNQQRARDHAERVQTNKLFLTSAQAAAIASAANATYLYGLVLCCLDMGTRINEANGALVEDLDLERGPHGVLYIRNQVQRYKKVGDATSKLHNGSPKSRAGYRPLLLSAELRHVVCTNLEKMENGQIPKSQYLFSNTMGKPHSYSTIHEVFGAICKRAHVDLPRGSATHVLRRYFLNNSRYSGVDEEIRAQVAGHVKYHTTALQYEEVDQASYEKLFAYVQRLSRSDETA